VYATAFELDGLAGLGEAQVAHGAYLDAADLPASVPSGSVAVLQRDLTPRQRLELCEQLLLVALHDHDEVCAPAGQILGVGTLGMKSVAGDHHAGNLVDRVEQRSEAGGLTRLLADVELGENKTAYMVDGCEQVDIPAVRPGRAAQALAVHCERAQPAPPLRPCPAWLPGLRAPSGEPPAHGPVQCVAVEAGQDPADGGLVGHRALSGQSIRAPAESGQRVRRGVGDPLADREQRGRTGKHRRRGQRQDVD
jgi:hypothetical protein